MNTKRLYLSASMLLSVGAFLHAAHPRIAAWSQTANSNLIAQQRAATCLVAKYPVQLGQQMKGVNPGQLVCHWDGSTAEVGNDRRLRHIKNGSPNHIQQILEQRGFRREANT